METIYIAGPVKDNPDYFAEFKKAEKLLKECGYAAVNPVKMFAHLAAQGASEEQILTLCLAVARECDNLALLPGWRDSAGALKERMAFLARHSDFCVFDWDKMPEKRLWGK